MRTIVSDDDGTEWSMEILDGDRVHALVGQIPPRTSNNGTAKTAQTFLLNDFSTNIAASAAQLTGQKTEKRAADTERRAPPCILPPELLLGEGSHSALGPQRSYPTTHQRDDDNREWVQFPKPYHHTNPREPVQITRDSSSSSNSSGKVDETLPIYSFREYVNAPAVAYIKSESEANSLVQTLRGPLGFDLEWRVMWHPGAQERRTALVQLCDYRTILLIQVSAMKRFPRKVLEVIESPDIVKTGANILNDGNKLYRDFGIQAKGLVELGAFANEADDKFSAVYNREIVSLAKMVAEYLGKTLLKGKVRTSNWEAELSRSMVEYAANDCHCALMVYHRLHDIADEGGKTLDLSTYSCQVNPRSLKRRPALPAIPPQSSKGLNGLSVPHYCIPEPPRPQQLRAYKLWHVDKMSLDQMCMTLRTNGRVEPLKESTVISYIIGALQADPRLLFNMDDLKALVLMEASSWQRHRQWIASRG